MSSAGRPTGRSANAPPSTREAQLNGGLVAVALAVFGLFVGIRTMRRA